MVQLLTVTCVLLVLSNERERDEELECAAVSGEERYATTLIPAAKETRNVQVISKSRTERAKLVFPIVKYANL